MHMMQTCIKFKDRQETKIIRVMTKFMCALFPQETFFL